jgi:hypothetical protein
VKVAGALAAGSILLVALVALGTAVSARSVRADGESKGSPPPPGASVAGVSSEDPYPVDAGDRRVRCFETRGRHASDGVLVYEVVVTGTERLSDGRDYVVFETSVRALTTGSGRRVMREWLRRDTDRVVCGRRQEGEVTADLDPVETVVELPLALERSWVWEGRAGGLPCRATTRVAARERVTVPFGTFDEAYRLDIETTCLTGDRVLRSIWLAPGVGLVQERGTNTTDRRVVPLDAALVRVVPAVPPVVQPSRRRP